MRKSLNITLSALAFCFILAGGALAAGNYAIVRHFAGPDGDYDYITVDSAAKRLFVGRASGVMAVDLATGKVTDQLVKAKDVSAVLLIPATELMLSTANSENKAIIFNRRSGKVLARITAGSGPDAAAYDPPSGLAFVMNGDSHDMTVIDVAKMAAIGTVALGGAPEAGVSDGHGHLYVNIEDKAEVAVVDIATGKVVQRWPLQGCVEPTGIAYDAKGGLLISACHNSVAKLTDARTGQDKGSVKIGKYADGAIFDPARRLAYVSCYDGTLTIFRLGLDGLPEIRDVVKTQVGARTSALDSATGRIYLPTSTWTKDKKGERVALPGSFNILEVARK